MKLKQEQLTQHLAAELAPIYILSGDEPLQISECADLIRRKARSEGFVERTVYHIDKSFEWREFIEAVNSLSLFSEKKIIELRVDGSKLSEAGKRALLDYLSAPSPDNLLMLFTHRIEGQTQKAKWFKTLEQAGVFITVWPLETKRLPGWIARRLRESGFAATPEALTLLTERVEGNLLAASQEIEKLKLLAKGTTIDEETVRESVSDNARYDIFHLSDVAVTGDIKSGLRILATLKAEGVEPPVILWALIREIRLLIHVSRLLSKGQSFDTALTNTASVVGFSPFLLKKKHNAIRIATKRHSEKTLRSILLLAEHTDRAIKGVDSSSPWHSLRLLLLAFAGVQIPA